MNEQEVFVKIGDTALRTPDGGFMPAVSLYVKKEDLSKLKGEQSEDFHTESLVYAFKEQLDKEELITKKGGNKKCQSSNKG